jgi:uncharacterized protein YgiM (DUF1202 family)
MRMKFGFTLALLLALGFSAWAQESNNEAANSFAPIGTGVAKQENVNVRGQASFIGEVIAKLKKGEEVTLLEEITLKNPKKDEPAKWYRISLPANTPVWAFSDFIDPATKKITSNRLNLRAGPGENFSILGRMEKGEEVKLVSTKGDWTQIEAPADAYAFLAADLIEKKSATAEVASTTPAPEPAPAPEPPAEKVEVPAAEALKPAEPEPTAPIAPAETAQPIAPAEPAPVITVPEPAPADLPKRIVKREGIVSRTVSIQAPTYFELESIDTGRTINYLHAPEEIQIDPKTKKKRVVSLINLDEYLGKRIVVTGEEVIDKRWKKTPVIEIETIDLVR